MNRSVFQTMRRVAGLALLLALSLGACLAQDSQAYQKPPREILDLIDVSRPPMVVVTPDRHFLLTYARSSFLSLEDLAAPELKLAGLRINPRTYGPSRTMPMTGVSVQELATLRQIPVTGLPGTIRMSSPVVSPSGRYLSFVEIQPEGLALWVLELSTGSARRLTGPMLNAVMGVPYVWAPDEKSLYCRMRPDSAPFAESRTLPSGPMVQEATGVRAPARTFPDLLRNPEDERKFEHYVTSVVRRVALDGTMKDVLPAALYTEVEPSPDGHFLLVSEIHRPFSYQLTLDRFPSRVRVTDAEGKPVAEIVDKPLRDRIPIDNDATEPGPRDFGWRDDRPSSLVWAAALDGGDPSRQVPERDALYQLESPFTGKARQMCRFAERFYGAVWSDGNLAIVYDGWWKTRHIRVSRLAPDASDAALHTIFDYSMEDIYKDPGHFDTVPNAFNRRQLRRSKDGGSLYLLGEGFTAKGPRPFLDAFDLKTDATRRLWQADGEKTQENIVGILDVEKGEIITRIQGPTRYPNLYLRTIGSTGTPRQLSFIENPFKSMEGVKKEVIRYKREDGVELSATLYLPPGYDAARDGKLPVLMEAYPTEYKDPNAAGQMRQSPNEFMYPSWASAMVHTMRGYAVLEETQFPIIGQGKTEPNDTFLQQLVMNARAAIAEVDRRGVGDPRRVACIGHSYGAFMVANLLAHSDLFAAGIARSGAYNRTLTPFGFQSEERNYWQAPDVYRTMSPFHFADKIKSPILLVHGDADNNPGTFTLQSERLFQAIKGLGGKARLVLLPFESHGYSARENILHLLWEQDNWLETHVKNRKP